jgi:glycine oxidase
VNILVVGAGVVGCAIAHELASRGARVRVIDVRGIGLGATRASAGILAPHIEGHIPALHAIAARSLALYDAFVRRVADDSGQAIEYDRSGTLQVALDAADASALCISARTLAELGVEHTLIDAAAARRLEPGVCGEVTGGLLVPSHGYIAVGALTRALEAAASRRGAVFSVARALSIEASDNSPRVIAAGETIQADAVVVAAGSWSDSLGEQQAGAVKPIRGQLVQLRLDSPPASRVIWGSRCYVVPWSDGTVLVGATSEDVGFDEAATAAGVRLLLESSAELIPALRSAAFEEVRVGLRPMTRDELPAIGPSSRTRRVFYATGHYRNGVLLAPLTATLIADLVIEGREGAELALTVPARLGL